MADKKFKYSTQEEAEKAYAELESKLGAQAAEVSAARAQAANLEKIQKENGAYQAWAQQVSPVVKWVNDNRTGLEQYQQAAANPAPQYQGYQEQQQHGTDTSILTDSESAAIASRAAEMAQQQTMETMNAWAQKFGTTVEGWANTRLGEVAQQNRSGMEGFQKAIYGGLEHVLPKEKLDAMRNFHSETLKYSDPSNIKPMELANKNIDMMAEVASLKAELAAGVKAREDQEAQSASLLDGINTMTAPAIEESTNVNGTQPRSDQDMLRAIEERVTEQHGADALQELYK